MFSSPIFTVSWRNNVLETWTLENHNTLSGFCKIIFSLFTKLVSDIKYKIMEKTTRASTLSLPVFMGNNPPRLLKCLLEILNTIILSKHLLVPVKKKYGMRNPPEIFFHCTQIYFHICRCVLIHMWLLNAYLHMYTYTYVSICAYYIYLYMYTHTCVHICSCVHIVQSTSV